MRRRYYELLSLLLFCFFSLESRSLRMPGGTGNMERILRMDRDMSRVCPLINSFSCRFSSQVADSLVTAVTQRCTLGYLLSPYSYTAH